MDIKEKLKGIMTEEETKKFESALQTIITEQVEARLAAEIDGIKKKYDIVAEEYCKKTIAEGVEAERQKLITEYDQKMLALEDKVIKGFDTFLEQEILPQISDETIKKIAINEAFAPIVTGIKKVLEENFIAVDTEGSNLLTQAKQEIVDLKEQLSESIAEKMVLNERLEKVAKFLLISESTNGLNEEQKKRVSDMFSDKGFEETEEKVKGYVQFLIESAANPPPAAPAAPAVPPVPGSTPPAVPPTGVIMEGAAAGPTNTPPAVPKPEDNIFSDEHVIERAERFMI